MQLRTKSPLQVDNVVAAMETILSLFLLKFVLWTVPTLLVYREKYIDYKGFSGKTKRHIGILDYT